MPEYFDESIVKERLGIAVGGVGVRRMSIRHERSLGVTAKVDFDVKNFAVFSKMLQQFCQVAIFTWKLKNKEETIRYESLST